MTRLFLFIYHPLPLSFHLKIKGNMDEMCIYLNFHNDIDVAAFIT